MVLDTSFVIDLLRERAAGVDGPAASFLGRHRNATVSLPLFARCELELGAERSSDPQRERQALRELTELVTPIDPAPGFEVVYAQVVSRLLSSGTPIPLMDALIGTLALQYSQAVVTRDVDHFRSIPGLVVHEYRKP